MCQVGWLRVQALLLCLSVSALGQRAFQERIAAVSDALNNPSAQPCSSEIPLVPLGISCHLGSTLWNNSASIKTKQKMPQTSLLSGNAGETWKLSEFLGNLPRYN